MESLENAQPPVDTSEGWKPDPLGSGNLRHWNGQRWTQDIQADPGKKPSTWKRTPRAMKITIVALVALVVIVIAVSGNDDSSGPDKTPATAKSNASKPPVTTKATENEPPTTATTAGGEKTPKPKPAPDKPEMTPGQENALQAAKDYLSFSAFSKAGLINQLSSKAGDGFPKADATFAVDHVGANWKEQAYKSAKDYLSFSSFSLSGLIDQLSSKAGDQFTPAQAKYGATKAYNGS